MADIESPSEPVAAAPQIANPAPLGLSAFALTTFVLSCENAGLYKGSLSFLGLALFYGGIAQLCAGMWEFRTGNTFGATAFTSYGAFWLALTANVQFNWMSDPSGKAFFMLGWTLFTLIMFLGTLKTSGALIALFGLLLATFCCLTAADFGWLSSPTLGGYLGIATALVAWYSALAGLLASGRSAFTLPLFPID